MKKHLALSLSILLLLGSCAGNSGSKEEPDPPSPVPGEVVKILSAEALKGTWEMYYFTKQADKRAPIRNVEADGFKLTFIDGENYYEDNPNPDEDGHITEGKFKVLDNYRVQFTANGKNGKEATSHIRDIRYVSNLRLTSMDKYSEYPGNKPITMTDTKSWRNTATMPALHPGITKEEVNRERIKGDWIIYDYLKLQQDVKAPDSDSLKSDYMGQWFRFNIDGTYISYYSTGTEQASGKYVIVDDVVHLFYEGTEIPEKPEGNPNLEPVMEASTFWIKDWGLRKDKENPSNPDFEAFEIYDYYMVRIIGTDYITTIQTATQMKRKI